MSVLLTPPADQQDSYDRNTPRGPATGRGWSGPAALTDAEGVPWGRYFDVLKRNTILILVLAALGSALGFVAVKRIKPTYDAQSTIWINAGTGSTSQQQVDRKSVV